MGACVATNFCSARASKTLWSFWKRRNPMRLPGEWPRLEKAPLQPDLRRRSLLSPSRPSKLTRMPNFKRLDLSKTSTTSFVQSVRFCSSSKRGAFNVEAPIGIFAEAPAAIFNFSLGGHCDQSFNLLSRHVNIYFKRKYCVSQAENAYLGSQWHSRSQQAARAQNVSEGKDAMRTLGCQDKKQESSEAGGRRRTEQHPVEKTSLYRSHLSTQSSSQTQRVPKYGGLFYSFYNATTYGENYYQMADHVNQYFKGKGRLAEGPDRIESEPGTATSEKTVSFFDYFLHPTSTIPDLLGVYQKLGSLIQTGKPNPTRTLPEATLNRTVALSHRQAEEVAQGLMGGVAQASSPEALSACVEALNEHLISYPSCKELLWQEKTAATLLRNRQIHRENQQLQEALRETLALIGYIDPVKGRGIRVLSVDGGGTRGVVPLQMLKLLEAETGKKVHQMFDYICGVSTGSLLTFMLGLDQVSVAECADMYRRFCSEVFRQNPLVGTVKMGWSHSYYSTATWEAILQEKLGDTLLIKTARDVSSPKVSAVSAVVNWGATPAPFVFRNYNHKPGSLSRYAGGSGFRIWQAVRASSAAPGYFEEFPLQSDIHQDGGIILNNPCALAVHESRLLWPNQPFQCVLSLGTGRYNNPKRAPVTSTSLKAKISNLINSATDTEGVHTLLDDLLPPGVYFRFNPELSAVVSLDENRPQALDQLQTDTRKYLERNRPKLARLCLVLGEERSAVSRAKDWLRERTWVMKQRFG